MDMNLLGLTLAEAERVLSQVGCIWKVIRSYSPATVKTPVPLQERVVRVRQTKGVWELVVVQPPALMLSER